MPSLSRIRFNKVWLQVHLWLGIAFCALLIPVGLSGSVLVWHDWLEEVFEPQRYEISGQTRGVDVSQIVGNASSVLGPDVLVTAVRFSAEPGAPVVVTARAAEAAPGERPRSFMAWIDPPTGKVLDSGETTSAFFGIMHRLHGSLLVPNFSGRQIVGWTGVALLISALSGLYLWWPRVQFTRGLRWGRTPETISNIHYTVGFWIAIPLAIVAFTGIYVSFPQTARAIVDPPKQEAGRGPQQQQRPGPAKPLTVTTTMPDEALSLALSKAGQADPLSLSWPTETNASWRAQMRTRNTREIFNVTVDDKSREVKAQMPGAAPTGDLVARWMRRIHDGTDMGFIWQVFVFATGLIPALMAVTGIIMWLRRRGRRAALMAIQAPAE